MNKSILRTTYFKLFIIGAVGIVVISVIYNYSNEEEDELRGKSFNIQVLTQEQFINEELQKIKTDNQYTNEILFECGQDEHCVIEALQVLGKRESKQTILDTIDDILSTYLKIGYYCHREGHHIGEFVYGYIGNVTEALVLTNIKCGGSVYHGIIENFFITEIFSGRSPEDIKISDFCEMLGNYTSSLERTDCAHGLGHGMTKAYDFEIFSAVKRCDELETAPERQACNHGVFMENTGQYLYKGKGVFDDNDILFPCNRLEEKYEADCYFFHTTYILKKNNFSALETFQECEKLTSSKSLKYCYMGVGRQMLAFHFDDMSGLALECEKGNPLYQPWCIQGAVLTIAEMNPEQAFEFCMAAPEYFKMYCYESLGNFIQRWKFSNEDREKECSKVEAAEYYQICTKRALQETTPKYLESFWS